jgi:hypothetical protein
MALTIEDGTGIAGAVSFVTVAEARTFAAARGITLSATDSVVEILLVKAGDYLLGLENKFKGSRSTIHQRLPFPRYDVFLPGEYYLGAYEIPAALKEAQIQLAMEAVNTDLRPTVEGYAVIREKVGPLETEYSTGSGSTSPAFNKVADLLLPLMRSPGRLSVFRA